MKTPDQMKLVDPADARNFQAGMRIVKVLHDDRLHAVIEAVDAEAGVISLRSPTRWERIQWWLGVPLRLLRRLHYWMAST